MPRPTIFAMISAFVFTSLLLTAGCGQKGPLYLPDEGKSKQEQSDSQKEKKPTETRGTGGY